MSSGGVTNEPSTITLNAVSWSARVPRRGVRFAPLIDLATAREPLYGHWQQIEALMPTLPDPADFPPLPGDVAASEADLLHRFVACAEEMPESSLVTYPIRFESRLDLLGENTLIAIPSREALRGGVVLLRQLHSPNEEASYATVRSILNKASRASSSSEQTRQEASLTAWQRLHVLTSSGMIERRLEEIGMKASGVAAKEAESDVTGSEPRLSFEQLSSLFLYGDLIHWGKRREEHTALIRDDFWFKRYLFDFLTIASQLAYFYMGYSVLVRAALREPRTLRAPGGSFDTSG